MPPIGGATPHQPAAPSANRLWQLARIRTIHYGIGAVGAKLLRLVVDRPDIEVVGVIDPQSERVGRDAGEAAGINRSLGINVSYDPELLLRDLAADVVLHSTESGLAAVYPQILQAISAGRNVISSCGELTFPWVRYPDIAQRLERRAREVGVRVLGIGVSTGFVMDALSLVSVAACQQIKSLQVTRRVGLSPEQLQLGSRVGAGLSLQGFQMAVSKGVIGHVGLRESLFMIADTLGWRLDEVVEVIEPVLARERIKTDYFMVDKGYVAGIRQVVRGLMGGREVGRLEVEMSLGVKEPLDQIVIDGNPPISVHIPGGVQDELTAAALMTNCIPAVVHGRAAGLLFMRDMPMAPYRGPGLERGPALQSQETSCTPRAAQALGMTADK